MKPAPSSLSKTLSPYVPMGLLIGGLLLQGAKTPLTFFIWGSIVLVWLLLSFLDRPQAYRTACTPAFLGFLFCVILSQLFSLDPSTSLFPALQLLVLSAVWTGFRSSPDPIDAAVFWKTMFASGVITLGVTLYQIKTGPNALGLYETYGLLPSNPSFNAIWMCSLAVAFITRALNRRRLTTAESLAELLLAGGLALLVVVNPARTRSAPLALIVALIYLLSVRYSWKKIALGALLLGGLGLAFVPMNFLEAHLRISGKYAEPNYRTRIWGVAVQSALDRPVTGYGPGNFEMGYQRHAFPVKEDFVQYARTTQFAHSEYLQAASDLGFPTFVLALFFLLAILRQPTRRAPELQKPAKAVLIALCCDAAFNPSWHVPFLAYLTLLWSALLLHPVPEKDAGPARVFGWSPRLGMGLITLGLFVLLGYSAVRAAWGEKGNWAAILRWNPHDAPAWSGWGDQQTDPVAAIQAQQRAARLCPRQPYFHESLAFALERAPSEENLQLAQREFQAAFELAPTRALYALSIGRHTLRSGNARNALPWFEKARQLEPHYWESYLWIARCLDQLGQTRRALWVLRQLTIEREAFLVRQRDVISRLTVYQPSGYERMILGYNAEVVHREQRKLTRKQG